MRRRRSKILECRLGTGSKNCLAIERVSTAFGSTTSGACASAGRREMPTMSRSRTITHRLRGVKLPPVHPGEILVEEFLMPFGISQYRLAKDIRVPPRRINEIVHGMRSITADSALRLAKYFRTSPAFWMSLQGRYDLEVEKDRLGSRLEKEVASFATSAR